MIGNLKTQNNIALLYIEEPEAFMHPQLQKKFILYLEDALKAKMEDTNLFIQVIVSTHSSKIVQSKITNSNSLNFINLLQTVNNKGYCSILNDDCVPQEIAKRKYFLQRLSLELCEVIFSDGIIAVEGDSEKILLPFYIENDTEISILSKMNIALVGGFGRDFKNYYSFFVMLGIPTLIITDLDISSLIDKELFLLEYIQKELPKYKTELCWSIDSKKCVIALVKDKENVCLLEDFKIVNHNGSDINEIKDIIEKYRTKDLIAKKITYGDLKKTPTYHNDTWITNYSIIEFVSQYISESELDEQEESDFSILNITKKTNKHKNIILSTQNLYSELTDESVICTSFEEALLHGNKGNAFVEQIIKQDRPNLFSDIDSLYDYSRYIQKKISYKTDIAIGILEKNYEIQNNTDKSESIILPKYIKEAIKELIDCMRGATQ